MSTAAPASPATAPALLATVVRAEADLDAHRADWDALADTVSRPFCASAWLLGWWRNAAPADAELAVVLVHEGDALVGVAPAFLDPMRPGIRCWRPLAAQACQRVEPFAAPGREQAVARAIGAALAAHAPRPDVLTFEGIGEDSPWPGLIAAAWPGRTRTLVTGSATALVLDLASTDFDGWFMAKSSHFRQRLRKQRKDLAKRDGGFRVADASSAAADIEAFLRVHTGRWAERGGTAAVPPPIAATLRDAGPGLVADGRLRIWSLDLADETIASSLVFRAGSEDGYWLNGFDEAHHRLEPSKVSILQVIEDAFGSGQERLDLGEGVFAYKRRFTDTGETLLSLAVVPAPGRRSARVLAALAPVVLRRAIVTRLSDEQKDKIRSIAKRVS